MENTYVLCAEDAVQGLHVIFERRGDRFMHYVGVASGDCDVRQVIRSVEGDPHESWPASPPIQEVHIEDRPDGSRVALCVGMAGASHWSLSVELTPDGRQANFDVACRMREMPVTLGTQYEVLDADGMECIEVATLGDHAPTTQTERDDRLLLTPLTMESAPPQTVQWQYVVAIR